MYCLRWWIPLFLLPFPTAPPTFLILFIIAYALHNRPCAYCGVIIAGLFVSSCFWYVDSVPAQALLALRLGGARGDGGGSSSSSSSSTSGDVTDASSVVRDGGVVTAAPTAAATAGGDRTGNPLSVNGTLVASLASLAHQALTVRCPGAGRCWLDFSLAASFGLFSPNRPWRVPPEGCGAPDSGGASDTAAAAGTDDTRRRSERSASAASPLSPYSYASALHPRLPTLQELLDDARRQVEAERAYSEELRRQIEQEQEEVVQVVVAAEKEERELAAAAAQAAASGSEAYPSAGGADAGTTTTTTLTPNSAAKRPPTQVEDTTAAAAAAVAKKERQSRARRIRSRSRKPAFRKAVPELDGEHTRGTYWIGVPGTAVGAFFDFSLR